jgi:tetratricopeptide (TPR) repeat protein
MTQRELAAPRYTKAYVSALENGLIKPSLAALRFLATRLGTVPEAFLSDQDTQWVRVEAELRLATGDWLAAADRFRELLDTGIAGIGRGMALLGLAEAAYRLGRAREAIAAGTEARELLTVAGRPAEARRAAYWLAAGHHLSDDPTRARMLFEEILAATSAENSDPDLRVRTLVALATVVSYSGEAEAALALLEEARGIGADLDDRRRATLLHSLAQTYRTSGDLEGAIRTGVESLALFHAVDARAEAAMTENELALIFLGLGNLGEAERHATTAIADLERERDEFHLAHVEDTAAQVALARGDLDGAVARAGRAARLAEATKNQKALIDALVTTALAARRSGDHDAAIESLRRAAAVAEKGPSAWLRRVLTEWSEIAAEAGDHAGAYELTRRALALG